MPRTETPEERTATRKREKEAKEKEAEAAGITKRPRGAPRKGMIWDERAAQWIPAPPPVPALTAAPARTAPAGPPSLPRGAAPASPPGPPPDVLAVYQLRAAQLLTQSHHAPAPTGSRKPPPLPADGSIAPAVWYERHGRVWSDLLQTPVGEPDPDRWAVDVRLRNLGLTSIWGTIREQQTHDTTGWIRRYSI